MCNFYLNMDIREDKTNEKMWDFRFCHFLLLQLTVWANFHQGLSQELGLLEPSTVTIHANLSSNPFILMEIKLLFLPWIWESEIHFGKKFRVLFLAPLSQLLSPGRFYAAAPLCENRE